MRRPYIWEAPWPQSLVIDDEEGVRNLLDTLLSRKGYEVLLASNGQKGLELFRRKRPDVVVLDLKMPEMNGFTVLQQVRQLNPTQPVVILTGAGTAEAEQQVAGTGGDRVRRKRILAPSPGGRAETHAQHSQRSSLSLGVEKRGAGKR